MNFIATIHGIYDDTKSQFAVSTATHPPGLFADLATRKDGNLPTQAEKRERKLQMLVKEINKPIALFIDEAHDLHPRTLVSLKHIIETVQDVNVN